MLYSNKKYYPLFLHKIIVSIVVMLFCSIFAHAQNITFRNEPVKHHYNTVTAINFNSSLKVNARLKERLMPPKNQLMSWHNYYLTAAQIEQRDRNKRLNQSIGRQIANDMLNSYVNALIYGKKSPVVVAPKF
jgi:hypothetical protein